MIKKSNFVIFIREDLVGEKVKLLQYEDTYEDCKTLACVKGLKRLNKKLFV